MYLKDSIGSTQATLWFQSVQGSVDGKRVHLGTRAVFYPDKRLVVIEHWGPNGKDENLVLVPSVGMSKEEAILFLHQHGCSVPADTLRDAQEKQMTGERK